jgi:hypothetical protein
MVVTAKYYRVCILRRQCMVSGILFNAGVVLTIAWVRLWPREMGPVVEWTVLREPSYMLFCMGMFLNLRAVYFAYFHVSSSCIFDEMRYLAYFIVNFVHQRYDRFVVIRDFATSLSYACSEHTRSTCMRTHS